MRSDGRILTTHTGSLPRTPDLGAMIDARERGAEVDSTAFRRVAEAAVDRVVVKQLEAGIDVGSDGEQPRASYCTYAADRMRGFGGESHRAPLSDFVDYPEFAAHYAKRFMSDDAMARQPAAIGDVVYDDLAGVDEELDIFKSVLERQQKQFADAFMTASSPGVMVLMMRNQHYPTEGDYIAALAPEIAKEYQRIVERDLILQVDCPDLPAERITNYVDVPFNEYLGIVERNIGELNRSLEGIPPERVRMHCCWGNYAGPHTRDPALRDLMSRLYEANVGTLVLPFGNPRHEHEIDVFREFPLPDDMAVVVGVIDVTTNWVEHPKLIAKRLVTAAEAIGDPTRVIAGTDCGFGTFWDYALVADEVVWLKLKALREGADLASEQLWR